MARMLRKPILKTAWAAKDTDEQYCATMHGSHLFLQTTTSTKQRPGIRKKLGGAYWRAVSFTGVVRFLQGRTIELFAEQLLQSTQQTTKHRLGIELFVTPHANRVPATISCWQNLSSFGERVFSMTWSGCRAPSLLKDWKT